MRLLFIQRSVGAGGSKNSLLQTLAVAGGQADFQGRVVVGGEGAFVAECRALGIETVMASLPEWRKFSQRLFFKWKMKRVINQVGSFAPDYVISNEMWWAPHAIHLAKKLNCKSACVIRDTLAAGYKGGKYHLHKLDRILCISAAMQRDLENAASLSDNTRLVYNAVLPPAIDTGAETKVDQLLGKFPHAQKWLLVIGRVGQRKNQIEAVRILGRLHQAGLRDFGLVLAGQIDANYSPALREVIAQFGLENFVCQAGQVEYIGNLIQRCEAMLLTSQREGLPRSIIESFLLGKPCFSTPLPGLDEIYGEEQSRFVSRGSGAASLTPLMLNALKNPGELRATTARVQENVMKTFSPENNWRQLKAALA